MIHIYYSPQQDISLLCDNNLLRGDVLHGYVGGLLARGGPMASVRIYFCEIFCIPAWKIFEEFVHPSENQNLLSSGHDKYKYNTRYSKDIVTTFITLASRRVPSSMLSS